MKRSEMVKIIDKEMRAQSSGHCDIDPNLVLAVIEAAGMLPPKTGEHSEDLYGDTRFRFEHKWSKE